MSMSQANHVGGLFGRINQTGYTSKTARQPVGWKSSVELRNGEKKFFRLTPEQKLTIQRREAQEGARRKNERSVNGLILPNGVGLADW